MQELKLAYQREAETKEQMHVLSHSVQQVYAFESRAVLAEKNATESRKEATRERTAREQQEPALTLNTPAPASHHNHIAIT